MQYSTRPQCLWINAPINVKSSRGGVRLPTGIWLYCEVCPQGRDFYNGFWHGCHLVRLKYSRDEESVICKYPKATGSSGVPDRNYHKKVKEEDNVNLNTIFSFFLQLIHTCSLIGKQLSCFHFIWYGIAHNWWATTFTCLRVGNFDNFDQSRLSAWVSSWKATYDLQTFKLSWFDCETQGLKCQLIASWFRL